MRYIYHINIYFVNVLKHISSQYLSITINVSTTENLYLSQWLRCGDSDVRGGRRTFLRNFFLYQKGKFYIAKLVKISHHLLWKFWKMGLTTNSSFRFAKNANGAVFRQIWWFCLKNLYKNLYAGFTFLVNFFAAFLEVGDSCLILRLTPAPLRSLSYSWIKSAWLLNLA